MNAGTMVIRAAAKRSSIGQVVVVKAPAANEGS